MSNNKSFEEKYPNISDFVYQQGKIEIGYDYNTDCFVAAYDEGGTVYQGKDSYDTMEEAFADNRSRYQRTSRTLWNQSQRIIAKLFLALSIVILSTFTYG